MTDGKVVDTLKFLYILLTSDGKSSAVGDSVAIAIEAIKKQIPAAPKHYKSYPLDIFTCASCGSTFVRRESGQKTAYCPNCGQKQNWKEIDNGEE